jgi:hypothetical protein
MFEGLINDEATKQSVNGQTINFQCFGFEYLLQRIEVPYSSISNGSAFDTVIFTMLNQAPFNTYVTVAFANIDVGNVITIDDKSDLENKTVLEALNNILIAANAVLYISGGVVYTSAREESVTTQYTFYGQASNNGIENIEDIKDYRNGLNRVFNYFTWKDTTLLSEDATSVALNGVRKKEIDLPIVTNNTSRASILSGIKTEFSTAKKELELICKFNEERLLLNMLDKVIIDFPNITFTSEGALIPIWGGAIYGTDKYPLYDAAFSLSTAEYFKIIGMQYNLTTERMTLRMRGV